MWTPSTGEGKSRESITRRTTGSDLWARYDKTQPKSHVEGHVVIKGHNWDWNPGPSESNFHGKWLAHQYLSELGS